MKCMIINIKTGNPIAYLQGISTIWLYELYYYSIVIVIYKF